MFPDYSREPATAEFVGRAHQSEPTSAQRHAPLPAPVADRSKTAVVYCEGNFGDIDGKTTVAARRSGTYDLVVDGVDGGGDTGRIWRHTPKEVVF